MLALPTEKKINKIYFLGIDMQDIRVVAKSLIQEKHDILP